MLDGWEAALTMISRKRVTDYIISCRLGEGLVRVGLALTITLPTMVAEGKPELPQRPTISLFGWEAIRQPAAVSSRHQLSRKSQTQNSVVSESEARVVTAIEAPGFNTVYLELETSGRRFWIAAASTGIRIGNVVRFSDDQALAVENFESKALKRTFERIYFVPTVTVAEIDP